MTRERDTRRLEVREIEIADAEACAQLWLSGYRRMVAVAANVPTVWLQEPSRVRTFIASRAVGGYVLTAGTDIVGYLVFDRGQFHGREAAFCPPLAHAVATEHEQWGYRLLYRAASADWVRNGVLDHYVIVAAHGEGLINLFFELGFGRYLIDAYRSVADLPIRRESACSIRRAGPQALAEVRGLMDMSVEFYLQAPLFLRQSPSSDTELASLLIQEKCAVFLAYVGGTAVGLMNVRIADDADSFSLADPETARLDPLGAYIRPEYRNRGIGDDLLAECIRWARDQGAERVHVDFEGANLYASAYWVKHFTPVLLSLKRSVHPDIM